MAQQFGRARNERELNTTAGEIRREVADFTEGDNELEEWYTYENGDDDPFWLMNGLGSDPFGDDDFDEREYSFDEPLPEESIDDSVPLGPLL